VEGRGRVRLPQRLQGPGGQTLSDILILLACKEMRVCFSSKLASQAGEEEVPTQGAVADPGVETARGALSGMLRKVICENVAPVLVQLKRVMEAERSTFIGPLQHCLCEILFEFKEELADVLGGDKELAGEVAFDMHKRARAQTVDKSKQEKGKQGRFGRCMKLRKSLGGAMKRAAEAATDNDASRVAVDSGLPQDAMEEDTFEDAPASDTETYEPTSRDDKLAATRCVTRSVMRVEPALASPPMGLASAAERSARKARRLR